MEVWGRRPNPPAITAGIVSGLAVPGALIEIEALAAVPSSDA
jgi:enamine deaminase RidA (YjgF/YER057c/UK114 family)